MKRQGWVRLWIVASAVGVPAAAIWQYQADSKVWSDIDDMIVKRCVDEEFSKPSHPDALECGRKEGAFKATFERESTTFVRYWSLALLGFFVLDCILTVALIGAFLIARWIVRGFRPAE